MSSAEEPKKEPEGAAPSVAASQVVVEAAVTAKPGNDAVTVPASIHKAPEKTIDDKRAELAAMAKQSEGGFIVAVITDRVGGIRRAVEIVNVDISGKKPGRVHVTGPKVVALNEQLLFTVNGLSYELDPEYVAFEIPVATLFYDRRVCEPIHFYEKKVLYKGEMVFTMDLLGHSSLRIDKLIMQKIVEIAAHERPEAAKPTIGRLVVAIITLLAFGLGLFAGAFILR